MAVPSSSYCAHCGALNPPDAAVCFACGLAVSDAASTPRVALAADHLLKGRYRLARQVGTGGFGAVYEARDTELGNRRMAIKEMSQRGLTPEELHAAVEAFHQEALLLAQLTHPSLPRIYEQCSEGGHWYLVMDFIDGETLEAKLNALPGKRVPLVQVLRLALYLADVLDYLHSQQPPVIFRDLKPANILVTPAGHVFLIDFGIARHFKPGQARDTVAFGSAGYAAPEQYGKAQTTAQADIYSLGATLHQMLSGTDPSDAPFVFAPLDVPALPALAALIAEMVQSDRHKRPASMSVVKAQLEQLAADLAAGKTGQPPAPPPDPHPSGRDARATSAPSPSPGGPPVDCKTLSIYTWHAEAVNALAWSPDGKLIASGGGGDAAIHVWEAAAHQFLRQYRGHNHTVNTLGWSPDGKLIASGGANGGTHVWEAATGKLVLFHLSQALLKSSVEALAWSPNGDFITTGGLDKKVEVWRASDGATLLTYHGHQGFLRNGAIFALAWSPDGQRIASGSADFLVQVWSVATGETLVTYSGHAHLFDGGVRALAWSPDSRLIASGGSDAAVHLWEAATGRQQRILRGPSGTVEALAWSPGGHWLAFGSADGWVRVWEAKDGRLAYVYKQHSGRVKALAWSPVGQMVASAGADGAVHVWQLL